MPRKPRSAQSPLEPERLVYEIPPDAPPTPEQMLAQFFGEPQAGDVICSIFELGGARRDERGFLFSFAFAEAPPPHELYQELLSKYGAGKYELHAQELNGKLVTRKVFQVGSERDRKRALIPDRQQQPGDAPRGPIAGAGDVSPALAALLEGQQRMFERLLEREAPREQRDTMSVARELLELKNLFATPAPAATPIAEILGIVKDVLKLKDELSADGGDESSPLVSALKQFAPAITRAVDKLAGPSPRSTAPAPAAGAGAATSAPARANGNHEGFTMNFDGVFAELAAHAEKGSAPDQVADAVLDWLADRPAWIEQAVLGMIVEERARVVNRIVGSYPKLEPKREWLTQVVSALLAKLEEAAAAETATPPEKPEPAANDSRP